MDSEDVQDCVSNIIGKWKIQCLKRFELCDMSMIECLKRFQLLFPEISYKVMMDTESRGTKMVASYYYYFI